MNELMTKQFSKQHIFKTELATTLAELRAGNFEAALGGNIYKKRIRFKGRGKSGSGRTVICYKKGDKAIFIHRFAKNEKSNLSKMELLVFKELSKILLELSSKKIKAAIENSDLIKVKS